jgi:hypothetical protein
VIVPLPDSGMTQNLLAIVSHGSQVLVIGVTFHSQLHGDGITRWEKQFNHMM